MRACRVAPKISHGLGFWVLSYLFNVHWPFLHGTVKGRLTELAQEPENHVDHTEEQKDRRHHQVQTIGTQARSSSSAISVLSFRVWGLQSFYRLVRVSGIR